MGSTMELSHCLHKGADRQQCAQSCTSHSFFSTFSRVLFDLYAQNQLTFFHCKGEPWLDLVIGDQPTLNILTATP